MKPLTEAQAWSVIAVRYDEVDKGWVGARSLRGLCNQISRLRFGRLITEQVEERMHNRKDRNEPEHRSVFWWPQTKEGAIARRDFCKRMAELAGR